MSGIHQVTTGPQQPNIYPPPTGKKFIAIGGVPMVDRNETNDKDRGRPVLGYSVKVYPKDPQGRSVRPIFDYSVPLTRRASEETLLGRGNDRLTHYASGTPENPKFTMTLRQEGMTVELITERGESSTDFCLKNGQAVRIVVTAVFEEEKK
jgi:hypothetical protein